MGAFRCGWCGSLTDALGVCLTREEADGISDADLDRATLVNGECCPNGDGSSMRDRQREEYENEMRRDAFGTL